MTEDDPGTGFASIGRQMVSGTLWMVAMRWLIRVIGLINTAIIARILMPEDFGIVALAMIAVDLLITLTDGDIEMAVVRSSDTGDGLKNTGWTLKIAAALLTFGVLWAIAPLVSAHFGDDRIATVIRIAALRPLILGLENIHVVEFRRTLRFSAEFRYLVAQRLGTFFAGLVLVFTMRDYLALAWTMPVSAVVTVALSYWIVPGRPRLGISHWREFWRFSRWQMLFNAARLVGERCDQVIIGRLAGLSETGLYVVGFDLALMPSREIMLPAGRALMPAYARLADDPEEMRASFRAVLSFAAIVAAAVGVGMSCVAEDAVHLVLGAQWDAAVPFVRWLGLFGAMEGLWLMLDPFLIAAGQEKTLAVSNLAFSALTIPVVAAVGYHLGIGAIPAARIAVMAAVLGGLLMRLKRRRWIDARNLVSSLWRPVMAALAMAAGIHFVHGALFSNHLLSLLADMSAGAFLYLGTLAGLWCLCGRPDGAERMLVDLSRSWFRRHAGKKEG